MDDETAKLLALTIPMMEIKLSSWVRSLDISDRDKAFAYPYILSIMLSNALAEEARQLNSSEFVKGSIERVVNRICDKLSKS